MESIAGGTDPAQHTVLLAKIVLLSHCRDISIAFWLNMSLDAQQVFLSSECRTTKQFSILNSPQKHTEYD